MEQENCKTLAVKGCVSRDCRAQGARAASRGLTEGGVGLGV